MAQNHPEQPAGLAPDLGPAALAQLASERRDLWPEIQSHPNCYPELHDWITQQDAQGQRGAAKPSEEEWAAQFQQEHGREPTMSEYQSAQQHGEIRRQYASVEQFSEGARKAAAGAKGFFDTRVAPAAKRAAQQAQQTFDEQAGKPHSTLVKVTSLAPMILLAAAFLGIFALFFPIATHPLVGSINFFSDEAEGEGVLFLILFLVTIGATVTALILKAKWATITAGAIGGVTGLLAVISGFMLMISISGESGLAVGGGTIFLALLGLVVLAASVLVLMSLRNPAKPTVAPPPAPPQA